MTSGTDQRTTDFEGVKKTLEQYQSIKLVQVEGDPPDSYAIEYSLTGLIRDADGTVRKELKHNIIITLPFGYPHFPPAVKPLTALFHPDIDPDAVRIASYWHQAPSLAELILYIGDMICGKVYNIEDPFNQEAADWYTEHADELPLDDIEAGDVETEPDLGLELELNITENDDDDDLGSALEIEEPEENFQAQLEEIRSHIARKELTIAGRLLADIPASSKVPEADEVRKTVESALQKRDQLLQELKELEDEDNFEEAEQVFEKIKEISVDTPGLADIGQRLRQSQSMLDTFSIDAPEAEAEKSQSQPSKKEKKIKKQSYREKKDKSYTRSRIVRTAKKNIPIAPFLTAGILAGVIIGSGLLYTRDTNIFRRAQSNWKKAEMLTGQKNFPEAKKATDNALQGLQKIFIPGTGKKQLSKKITALFASEEFQKGLEGKALYKDEWLPVEEVKSRLKLDRLTATARSVKKSGNIDKAVVAYQNALDFAAENGLEQETNSLKKKLDHLRIETALAAAGRAEHAEEWNKAAKKYELALEIADMLVEDESKEETVNNIKEKFIEATLNYEFNKFKKEFKNLQLGEGKERLKDLKELLEKNSDLVPPDKRKELKSLIVRSQFYQALSLAFQVYKRGDHTTALHNYRTALHLFEENKEIFDTAYNNNADKIRRNILKIEISIALKAVTKAEEQKDLQKALQHCRTVQNILSSADIAELPKLIDLKEKIKLKIKNLIGHLNMEKKRKWLHKNFERIFKEAYPRSRSSEFSSPDLTLIKKIKNIEIYNLNCIEKDRGGSYRLELHYQYNPATDQWTPYHGE